MTDTLTRPVELDLDRHVTIRCIVSRVTCVPVRPRPSRRPERPRARTLAFLEGGVCASIAALSSDRAGSTVAPRTPVGSRRCAVGSSSARVCRAGHRSGRRGPLPRSSSRPGEFPDSVEDGRLRQRALPRHLRALVASGGLRGLLSLAFAQDYTRTGRVGLELRRARRLRRGRDHAGAGRSSSNGRPGFGTLPCVRRKP